MVSIYWNDEEENTIKASHCYTQDSDDDNPHHSWCSCRKPSGDRLLIQFQRQMHAVNVATSEWYHGYCVGIAADGGIQMDT